ncbi:hypothetical protein PMI14_03144 [Acidovorax sp. CF316]|uniref:hypothetical protein n=1 Tax=Acidovorax sp. CF316 TaxID=1144317 RepID=UPI00026BD78B|nr:hypothetical protein [Acidovorax sp. CF316]EJE52166.1 hypothetical protein PMI14_03144 [Acidovorax sp. CF316]
MITVYLDSQDYSTLSSSRIEPAQEQIRERLREWSRSGAVRFVFSAFIVSEAAPTGPHANDFAIARGELLSNLCGENALLEGWLLLQEEARHLSSANDSPLSPLSPTGDFFPEIGFDDPPSLEQSVLETAPNRAQRRKSFKNGVVRPQFREQLRKLLSQTYVEQVVTKYPMKLEYADTFARFALGETSREEASAALRASIRDPRWLMSWFAANPELAKPIMEMVRKPGREMGLKARELIQYRDSFQSDPQTRNMPSAVWNDTAELKNMWVSHTSATVEYVAKRFCVHSDSLWPEHATAEGIAKYCPGLNAMVRSMLDSVWDSFGGGRKVEPTDSQFPDAMHAIYAPYVDVFRADRFMAPHIRRQLEGSRTTVVSLLAELPAVIERRLADR